MNIRLLCRRFGAIGLFLALLSGTCLVPTAMADGIRPVRVLVKELQPDVFDVKWSVPKVIKPQSMPSPALPEECRPEGERTFIDQPSAWLTRRTYRCPEGLSGQPLGISFPDYNIGLSTLLRVEFLSGERYARLLNPGEDSWVIPETRADSISNLFREAQRAVVDGVGHFFGAWVHLAFLLILCLLGGVRPGVRLATAFLLAQVAGVVSGSFLSFQLSAPLAEIGVALAAILLAREALRPMEGRKQLTILAACAGIAHGLGIPALVPLQGLDAAPGLLSLFLFVLGMDAALLCSVAALKGLGSFVPDRLAHSRMTTATVYGIGGAAFALAVSALVPGPALEAKEPERRLELPGMATSGAALPGSRRLAASVPDAAIQSFLAVEAFEIRHEILVRLKDVAGLVGVNSGPELAVETQGDVKEHIRELVGERTSLEIDGERADPVSWQADFMSVSDQGVLPRPTPVPETVETAWVGVTAAYLTKTTARDLALTWEFGDADAGVPATVSDPETSRSEVLSPGQPALRWKNELAEDLVPRVSAIAVEPRRLTVPLWSLAAVAAALILLALGMRRREPDLSLALARVMLVVAVLLGPFGNATMALPLESGSAPKEGQVRQILAGIFPNIYRAFEFREEGVVFDRLALSVTGDVLTEVYLDHRKVLAMKERGGARARVEAVEVLGVGAVESGDNGGFSADATWTVGGTVTHFGHRHFRQNRYEARVALVPDEGTWKIQRIEILNEERLR